MTSASRERLERYRARAAQGLEAAPDSPILMRWLKTLAPVCSVLPPGLVRAPRREFDLSAGAPAPDGPLVVDGVVGIGRYDEDRDCYSGDAYQEETERRTVHIGLDLFVPPGTPIRAPLDSVVHSLADNDQPWDYGPTILLEHPGPKGPFFTLYGHLSRDSLHQLGMDSPVRGGAPFARIGTRRENGGWPPHLHLQIITDVLDYRGDFPGVCVRSERALWRSLCPDPTVLLGR